MISGYVNGRKFNRKIKYSPTLYIRDEGEYQTVDGKHLKPKTFPDIADAREWVRKHSHQPGSFFGSTNYPYVYVYENFKEIVYDPDLLRVGNVDIETDSEDGYPDIQLANKKIVSITLKVFRDKTIYVLGLKPYETKEPELLNADWKIKYLQCKNERQLLTSFIAVWQKLNLDIITGWNIEPFDIPYIIKRIDQVLGEKVSEGLSPFGKIEKSKYLLYGKEMDKYEIAGIPVIDYMQAYKKFHLAREESYKLEYIANKHLGVGKLDYKPYRSLAELYKGDHNKFIDYNIIDVLRVEQLDDFLEYISQIVMLAHYAKANFVDTFGTVRMWDVMIHNYLMDQKIAIPQNIESKKERQIAGGYVKAPVPGRYKTVMSFDLTSLYPHLVMMYNISPETLLGKFDPIADDQSVDRILRGELTQYKQQMLDNNVTVSGKGTVFSRDKIGFLPKLMQDLFDQRKFFKKKMLKHKAEQQEIKAELAKRGLKYE